MKRVSEIWGGILGIQRQTRGNFSDTKQSLASQVEKETKGTYRDVLSAILDENREISNKVDNRKAQRDAEVSPPVITTMSHFFITTSHFLLT